MDKQLTCAICRSEVDEDSDEAVRCSSCQTLFHKECVTAFADKNKETKCIACGQQMVYAEPKYRQIRNLTIIIENTNKRIPIQEVDGGVTSEQLLRALAQKIKLPVDTRGTLLRYATHKQVFSGQSLQRAGIQDGELLIADFERTVGGNVQAEIKNVEGTKVELAGGDVKKDTSLSIMFGDVIGKNSLVYPNYSQEFIITTADKLKIFLIEYQEAFKARIDWITPLGILLAIIPTLVAAEFKKFLGLEPNVWQAIFIIGSVICFVWLLHAIYLSIKLYKKSSIEYIIQQIKKSSEKIEY